MKHKLSVKTAKNWSESNHAPSLIGSDEEIARRLQEEELIAVSPSTRTRRRTRKAPDFFAPPDVRQGGGYGGYQCLAFAHVEQTAEPVAVCQSKPDPRPGLRRPEPSSGTCDGAGSNPVNERARASDTEQSDAPDKQFSLLFAVKNFGTERAIVKTTKDDLATETDKSSPAVKGKQQVTETHAAASNECLDRAESRERHTEEAIMPAALLDERNTFAKSNGNSPQGSTRDTTGPSSVSTDTAPANKSPDSFENSSAPKRGRSFKIPKLPMVKNGRKWYRARLLKEAVGKVLVEFAGFQGEGSTIWLPKDSDRIWRGSYKGKDWKYLGDGAWEPKQKQTRKARSAHSKRKRQRNSCSTKSSNTKEISDGQQHTHTEESDVDDAGEHAAADSSERDGGEFRDSRGKSVQCPDENGDSEDPVSCVTAERVIRPETGVPTAAVGEVYSDELTRQHKQECSPCSSSGPATDLKGKRPRDQYDDKENHDSFQDLAPCGKGYGVTSGRGCSIPQPDSKPVDSLQSPCDGRNTTAEQEDVLPEQPKSSIRSGSQAISAEDEDSLEGRLGWKGAWKGARKKIKVAHNEASDAQYEAKSGSPISQLQGVSTTRAKAEVQKSTVRKLRSRSPFVHRKRKTTLHTKPGNTDVAGGSGVTEVSLAADTGNARQHNEQLALINSDAIPSHLVLPSKGSSTIPQKTAATDIEGTPIPEPVAAHEGEENVSVMETAPQGDAGHVQPSNEERTPDAASHPHTEQSQNSKRQMCSSIDKDGVAAGEPAVVRAKRIRVAKVIHDAGMDTKQVRHKPPVAPSVRGGRGRGGGRGPGRVNGHIDAKVNRLTQIGFSGAVSHSLKAFNTLLTALGAVDTGICPVVLPQAPVSQQVLDQQACNVLEWLVPEQVSRILSIRPELFEPCSSQHRKGLMGAVEGDTGFAPLPKPPLPLFQ